MHRPTAAWIPLSAALLTLVGGGASLAHASFGLPESSEAPAPAPVHLEPSPHYTPQQVIEIQLGALGSNAAWGEDRGLEVTFGFASLANRAMTGPSARFAAMVRSSYGALLDHEGARIGPFEASGRRVVFPVMVTAKDGSEHGYAWVLSRQADGPYADCWMTDAVVPVDLVR